MKWNVVGQPEAERSLTELWLSGRDREAISAAADQIDAILASDPLSTGESREGNRRIVICHPLAARVAVYVGSKTVSVLKIWEY